MAGADVAEGRREWRPEWRRAARGGAASVAVSGQSLQTHGHTYTHLCQRVASGYTSSAPRSRPAAWTGQAGRDAGHDHRQHGRQHGEEKQGFDETDGCVPGYREKSTESCVSRSSPHAYKDWPCENQPAADDSGFHEQDCHLDSSSSSSGEDSGEWNHTQTDKERRPVEQPSSTSTHQAAPLSKRQLKRQRRKEKKQQQEMPVKQEQISIRDELQKENEQLKQQLFCRVCMDALVGAMLLPCKHSVLCWACSQRLVNCPVCRATTSNRISIYLACA